MTAPQTETPRFSRLDLSFDSATMLREALSAGEGKWKAHFNSGYHDGGWQGVSLRSVDGDATRLYSDPSKRDQLADSDLMAKCPSIVAALRSFQCPLRDVRLLRLTPGAYIREHSDDDLILNAGEARLHIPLITHPLVEFYVDAVRVMMEAGECWYLNLSKPHRVRNVSPVERIHLVIDCGVNAWLRHKITSGDNPQRVAVTPSGQDQFLAFREAVWSDATLENRLVTLSDKREFIDEVQRLGSERGFDFGAIDVESAMTRGRQTWMSQWIM